jgi:hypothetical protein
MSEVTQLLRDWSAGRKEARDELLGLVYEPLRAIAERHLYREREGHTLEPTARDLARLESMRKAMRKQRAAAPARD